MNDPTTDLEHTVAVLAGDILEMDTATCKQERIRARSRIVRTLIRLRVHITDTKGYPDLTGTTGTYRSIVTDAYREANLEATSQKRIRSAVNEHLQQPIRDLIEEGAQTLPDDPYGYYGIDPQTSRQKRASMKFAERSGREGAVLKRARRIRSSLRDTTMSRPALDQIAAMGYEEREQLRSHLDSIRILTQIIEGQIPD